MNDLLITQHIKLVSMFVNRMDYGYVDKEDLFQAGLMGLYEASKRYDKDKCVKFSTFASYYIIGEIKNELRNNKLVKYGKKIYELKRKLQQITDLKQLDEFITSSNLDKELVYDYFANESKDIITLDNDLVNEVKENGNKSIFLFANECLDGVFLEVIKLKYINNYSQQEIGDILNISQSKVSRIEKVSLNRLKRYYLAYK